MEGTEKELDLKIISMDMILYTGKIKSLTVPGELGSFGILYGHAPIISSLRSGKCKIKELNGKELLVEIKGGMLFLKDNKISVLADSK